MKLLRWLLLPFSVLYGWITGLRNWQFDTKRKYTTEFDLPVISVGNLSMGGTGKTPMIEYLIRLLKSTYKLATVSRGYGRRTQGFRLAGADDNALTLGDEPYQFYRKFKDEVTVSVGEERILAIPSVLLEHPDTQVFLLDDAYQHRKVGRDLNILLTDFTNPFYEDYVVPVGRLREVRKGASRSDCVVVTKCPELSDDVKEKVKKKIEHYTKHSKVYFSSVIYRQPEPCFGSMVFTFKKIVLVTGLANPTGFVMKMTESYEIVQHFNFPDHHNFRELDLDRIAKACLKFEDDVSILTTEKDMVRLLKFESHDLFKRVPLFYVSIEFVIDRTEDFENLVVRTIEEKRVN